MTIQELEKSKDGIRFFKKVDRSCDCWIWTACKQFGYGWFSIRKNGKPSNIRAHQWIMKELCGPPPERHECCHKCNNRACVNPDHIYYGTRSQNQLDSIRAGTHNFISQPRKRGDDHPCIVLTDSDVARIYKLRETNKWGARLLARHTGFNENTINNILYTKKRFRFIRKDG